MRVAGINGTEIVYYGKEIQKARSSVWSSGELNLFDVNLR